MPRGVAIPLHIRQLIYQKVLLNTTAVDIFMELFNNQTNYVSLDYLRLICSRLIHDPFYVSHFTGGELHKSGRNRIIDGDENLALIDFVAENGRLNSQGIRDNFSAFYHGAIENPPYSSSTIRRQLARNRLSIKTTERRHMLRDDVMGMQYLDSIADIDPLNLIDIDEVSFAPTDFHHRRGWAPIGEPYVHAQIVVGTRSFSTIAAVTPLGFLCWYTFEGTI